MVCKICGVGIALSTGRRMRLYCSDACKQAAYRVRLAAAVAADELQLNLICGFCGAALIVPGPKYCSPACKQKAYRGRLLDVRRKFSYANRG